MAYIQIWQDRNGFQLGSITHYEKREYLIFGKTCDEFIPPERTPEDIEWFVFDLSRPAFAWVHTEGIAIAIFTEVDGIVSQCSYRYDSVHYRKALNRLVRLFRRYNHCRLRFRIFVAERML